MGVWRRLVGTIGRGFGPARFSFPPAASAHDRGILGSELGLGSRLHCLRFESSLALELKPAVDPASVLAASGLNLKGDTPKTKSEYIGYSVTGRLKVEKALEIDRQDAFAVIQIGAKQFKVTPGDCLYIERLKFTDINDKLALHKVLMLGTKTETIVGRPLVPNTTVSAIVEEHALDAKVIVFKKKRRKNYRRCNGHRQELTKIRITRIEGLDGYIGASLPKAAALPDVEPQQNVPISQ